MKTKKNESPEFIPTMDDGDYGLIPVHINKTRNQDYFYSWSSDMKGWVRGDKIPDHLNRMYKSPLAKSSYK